MNSNSANFTLWSWDLTFWDQDLTIFIIRKATSYRPPFILLPLGSFCYKIVKTRTTFACYACTWTTFDSYDLFKNLVFWWNGPKNRLFLFFILVLKRNLCSHRLRMGEIIAPRQVRQFCYKWVQSMRISHFDLEIWLSEIKI